jgi:glycosidase
MNRIDPVFEFHVSKNSRDYYQFDEALFAFDGNVILANFRAAREFAQKINQKRNAVMYPERAVRASELNAMGLIDEILHALLEHYREEIKPDAIALALKHLQSMLGENEIEKLLSQFVSEFPPVRVYQNQISGIEYLAGTTNGYSNQLAALQELIMLWLANQNPALKTYSELFKDTDLAQKTAYSQVFPILTDFFESQPPLENMNLIIALQEPARISPNSLTGQLEFLIKRWQKFVGSRFLLRILGSLDFLKEETKIYFGTGGGGDTPVPVYEFGTQLYEPEMFSPDRDWMPSLVLIAKNTYVWLDQLSKKYQRTINRLDQIPDEELDQMARMGFSGLWLIGLWERSSASQKIKQLCGNPEAVASAYSLYDYTIAQDLGGDEAYYHLKEKAWMRHIRLAADMVPNHVGIYSKWVIEHPDWFISLNYSPFPSYTFNGPDLSEDPRVGIYIEDHYYSRNDAAVVFKRRDHWTGSEQYIYHGNDGTSMPWNDTAQLNYLNPEVREAVIQTILSVARKFPVIRFDAAMTLAKKHFQRLWFPEPGSGGDIASRAEFGLTHSDFNLAMPEEFWRQVVDRVAEEVPDTLLLAEAFWLMEGYFVRTLGMHRVYNSAFMNMLRDEKNGEYRLVIKNTLEFDPEILKRYVNFMNNPDERTAVDQFGKGDKYFGVTIMMSTMPGLPMYGHGQIEGLTEKYGMEYRKAYWDEQTDQHLVERHQREISPLLHQRYIFAEMKNFLLYDFYTPEGYVNEDVYAYSNDMEGQRSLVIYHNRFADTRGWIRTSAAYAVKTGNGDEKILMQKTLAEGLHVSSDPNAYLIYRDQRTNLEYLRNCQEIVEQGFYIELGAYDYHVFLDFRDVYDNEWHHYAQLAHALGGKGVQNMDEALQEFFLQSIHIPFREIINAGQIRWIVQNADRKWSDPDDHAILEQLLQELGAKGLAFYSAVKDYIQSEITPDIPAKEFSREIELILTNFSGENLSDGSPQIRKAISYVKTGLNNAPELNWGILLAWCLIHPLNLMIPKRVDPVNSSKEILSEFWYQEWMFKKIVRNALLDMGISDQTAWVSVELLEVLIKFENWAGGTSKKKLNAAHLLNIILTDDEAIRYLGINRYQDILWYNQEAFQNLLWSLTTIAGIRLMATGKPEDAKSSKPFLDAWKVVQNLIKADGISDYQVNKLVDAAK